GSLFLQLQASLCFRRRPSLRRRCQARLLGSGTRRCFGFSEGGGGAGAMARKGMEESTKSAPWVPDPVTGYYRPENHANQIDVAELREMLLKSK
ncbi:hypothetical protein NMG60_11013806, partial [Bertholletia excelsa]